MASIFGSQTEVLKNQSFNVNKSPKTSSSMLANPRSRAEVEFRESNNFKRGRLVPLSTDKIEASLSKDIGNKLNRKKSINSKKPTINAKDSSFDINSQRHSSKEVWKKVSNLIKTVSSQNNLESKDISRLLYKSSNDLMPMDRLNNDVKGLASIPISTFSKLLNSRGESIPKRNEAAARRSPRIVKIQPLTHNISSLSEMNNSRQVSNRNSQSRLNSLSRNKPKHLSKTSENIAHQQQTVSSLTRIPRAEPFKLSSASQFYEKPAIKTTKNSCFSKGQILNDAQLSMFPSLTFGNINLFSKSNENKSDEYWPLSERGDLPISIETESQSNPKFFSKVRHLMTLSLKPKLPN